MMPTYDAIDEDDPFIIGPPLAEKVVDHFAGLDLGKSYDYSALVVIERTRFPRERKPTTYDLRHLQRWPLGTTYVVIVGDAGRLLSAVSPSGAPALISPQLVVDATGVGSAVVDMLAEAKSCPSINAVVITSGSAWRFDPASGSFHVAKKELVGLLHRLAQTGRLRFARDLPDVEVLKKELANFQERITAAGNVTYECLVAGTLIETSHGPIPIEDVEAGSFVLTRRGYRRVLWSGQTKTTKELSHVLFSSGAILNGTPDHLVWTSNRGWVSLEKLTCQDHCIRLRRTSGRVSTPRLLCGMVSSTGDRRRTTTTSVSFRESEENFIASSGSTTTARSLTDAISTTRMRTATTTTPLTSNASPIAIMRRNTTRKRLSPSKPVWDARECSFVSRTDGRDSGKGHTESERGIVLDNAPTVPVYDLVVEGEHEFFANGILVHNSWRDRDHDDLVLALAVALWYAETTANLDYREQPPMMLTDGRSDCYADTAYRSAIQTPPPKDW